MKPVAQTMTADELRALLNYDGETGAFSRKNGKPIGFLHHTGYITVKIGTKPFPAHRLAWLHVHGEWPGVDYYIDHINHDKQDNRISNLRKATHAQNIVNTKKVCNKTGFKGVYQDKRVRSAKCWFAVLQVQGASKYLGYYDNPEEAAVAYRKAAIERYGEFVPPE